MKHNSSPFFDELHVDRGRSAGQQIDIHVAIMDFYKVFDIVLHDHLMNKLHFCGIHGRVNRWINSFLSSRSHKVVIDGAESQEAPVTSGVPQRLVLGPILSLTFTIDLPECVSPDCRLFADDSTCIIYRPISSTADCHELQNDHNRLTE